MPIASTTALLLDRLVSYDGHVVFACRTGAGKTTTVLNYVEAKTKQESAEWLVATGKQSAWMGLEDQIGKDGQCRVLNVSVTEPESVNALLERLRWAVRLQETRESARVEKRKAGQQPNPRPIRILLDEWIVICKAAKRLGKDAFRELIDLVEILIFKGREDKVFLLLVAQGHHCGTLHLDGDTRTNLGVVALGGDGNYQSVTAAINDANLIEDSTERRSLQEKYQSLIEEDATGRIFYTSIGGHCVERMEVLPDLQSTTLFEPDPTPEPVQKSRKKQKPENKKKGSGMGDAESNEDSGSESSPMPMPESDEPNAFEQQQLEIERSRLKLSLTALRLQASATDEEAEARWNLFTMGVGIVVAMTYFVPPFSRALQGAWKASVKVAEVAKTTTDKAKQGADAIDKFVNEFAPDLKRTPKTGERIAGFVVTSPYGPRSSPGGVGSTYHRGVDLATPVGTPIYAIGKPGQTVTVKCLQPEESDGGGIVAVYESLGWKFLEMHLSACNEGQAKAGTIIGRTGNTGASTGPHAHHEMRNPKTNQAVPPQTGFVWWALTGDEPRPLLNRGRIEENKQYN